MIDDVGIDTYSDERCYSYRRSVASGRAGLRPARSRDRAGARVGREINREVVGSAADRIRA